MKLETDREGKGKPRPKSTRGTKSPNQKQHPTTHTLLDCIAASHKAPTAYFAFVWVIVLTTGEKYPKSSIMNTKSKQE